MNGIQQKLLFYIRVLEKYNEKNYLNNTVTKQQSENGSEWKEQKICVQETVFLHRMSTREPFPPVKQKNKENANIK